MKKGYIVKADVVEVVNKAPVTLTSFYTGIVHKDKAAAKRELLKAKSDPSLVGYSFYIDEEVEP